MAATDLLIDGYNLLHAAGLGRARYGPGDLQRARQALLRRLFELLTPDEILRTAVVFDARHPPPHLPHFWYIHGLRVVYARPHGDADLLLEQLIDEHSHPRQLTIVSSDQRLQRAAKSRRAVATNSDEFLEFLEQRRRAPIEAPLPAPAKTKPSQDVAAAELAYWMSVFGDVKVSDLVDPHRPANKPSRPATAKPNPSPTDVAPAKKSNPAGKARTRPVKLTARERPDQELTAEKPNPELFSAEWISELQRWVDQQQ